MDVQLPPKMILQLATTLSLLRNGQALSAPSLQAYPALLETLGALADKHQQTQSDLHEALATVMRLSQVSAQQDRLLADLTVRHEQTLEQCVTLHADSERHARRVETYASQAHLRELLQSTLTEGTWDQSRNERFRCRCRADSARQVPDVGRLQQIRRQPWARR